LGIPESEPVLLFFGLVRPYKGIDLLAEALALLPNPPLTLIVGEWYMPTDAFEQRLRQLGLSERVWVVNRFIPQQEIPLYFAAADLVVQPYRSATQSGITPLALRYERPVVVTNVGGLPEYVRPGQTGYIVEPRAEALAEAIADFFGNGRAREFAPFLHAAAREWSWEAIVGTLDLLAEDVLQARSRQ
jgi:glycosyltransferase involved in cell wall biosynthesis